MRHKHNRLGNFTQHRYCFTYSRWPVDQVGSIVPELEIEGVQSLRQRQVQVNVRIRIVDRNDIRLVDIIPDRIPPTVRDVVLQAVVNVSLVRHHPGNLEDIGRLDLGVLPHNELVVLFDIVLAGIPILRTLNVRMEGCPIERALATVMTRAVLYENVAMR